MAHEGEPGANVNDDFVFGQEKWEHNCEVLAFEMAKYAVTNEEFLQFVKGGDSGYHNKSVSTC